MKKDSQSERETLRNIISDIYLENVKEHNSDSIGYLTNLVYNYDFKNKIDVYALAPFELYHNASFESDPLKRIRMFANSAEQCLMKGATMDDFEYENIGILSYKALLYDLIFNYEKPDKNRKIDFINARLASHRNEFLVLSEYYFELKTIEEYHQQIKPSNYLAIKMGDVTIETADVFLIRELADLMGEYIKDTNMDKLKKSIDNFIAKNISPDYLQNNLIDDSMKSDRIKNSMQNDILDLLLEYKKNPSEELGKMIKIKAQRFSFDKNKIEEILKKNKENKRKKD